MGSKVANQIFHIVKIFHRTTYIRAPEKIKMELRYIHKIAELQNVSIKQVDNAPVAPGRCNRTIYGALP